MYLATMLFNDNNNDTLQSDKSNKITLCLEHQGHSVLVLYHC